MAKIIPYKFTIQDKLIGLSKNEYDKAMKDLPILLNISRSTFIRWRYTKKDSFSEIPTNASIALASYFDCSVQDIYTKNPKKNNSNAKG
jgi:hypothetical protein